MDIDQHLAALEREGRLLADAAARSGLDAEIPSCRPWRMRDLLRHVRYIHWWAGTHVRDALASVLGGPDEADLLSGGPPDADLIEAYRDGHRVLVETLRAADPGLACATFLPAPSPLAFWARRQAHETAIHRADAELATGGLTPFDPGFAVDGIDELVLGFAQRGSSGAPSRGDGAVGPGAARRLRIEATDTGDAWRVAIGADGIRVVREHAAATGTDPGPGCAAEAEVTAPAAVLYLLLWNRAGVQDPGITVRGDADMLALWRERVRVTWG
ncbi:MAG: maleylpyruvate isomerase family mycothiol-dependent enzyme [Streptosporangiaceae bacterium]